MLKTKNIEYTIYKFKNEFNLNKNNAYFVNYGSFYRKDKKYINDVDIHCIIKNTNISNNKNLILNIINTIENTRNIVYKKYYTGHLSYFYRKKYTLSYFKKLNNEKIISNHEFFIIKKLIESNVDEDIIKKKVGDMLEISWNIKEIKNGFKLYNGNRYDFFKCLKKDNFMWIDLIYKFKQTYIPIEFIIMSEKDFKKSRKKDNIYRGCKLPLFEFQICNYYNFIKRLQSCYCVNLKRKYYKKLSNIDCNFSPYLYYPSL